MASESLLTYVPLVRALATPAPARRLVLASSTQTPTQRLLDKWGGYCQALFRELLEESPRDLARLVANRGLRVSRLTYAAEILGDAKDSRLVKKALLPLLKHESPIVREGAILGLARHLDEEVRGALEDVAANDQSETIRRSASETLTD